MGINLLGQFSGSFVLTCTCTWLGRIEASSAFAGTFCLSTCALVFAPNTPLSVVSFSRCFTRGYVESVILRICGGNMDSLDAECGFEVWGSHVSEERPLD